MTEETNSKPKRPRPEEEFQEVEADTKRQKPSYEDILTILDEDEDLSPLISAVDREISSSDESQSPAVDEQTPAEFDPSLLMRHLLEASDDELGIPSSAAGDSGEAAVTVEEDAGAGDSFGGGDGLWEIDDESANYYALLQSELFM